MLSMCVSCRGADFREQFLLERAATSILPWIEDQIPTLFSPDSRQILTKVDDGNGTKLQLFDTSTRRLLAEHSGSFPLLLFWRPRSPIISFVDDNRGDLKFQLYYWDTESGRVARSTLPAGRLSADRFVWWAPDGGMLAFRATTKGGGDNFYLLENNDRLIGPVFRGGDILNGAWSPDSKRIAIVSEPSYGSCNVVNVDSGLLKEFRVMAGAKLRHLAWCDDGKSILVTYCAREGHSYRLSKVDTETGVAETVTPESQNVINPVPLPGGAFAYHDNQQDTLRVLVGKTGSDAREIGFTDGRSFIQALDLERNALLVEHIARDRPRAFYRVPIEGGIPEYVFGTASEALRGSGPETIQIKVDDGSTMPIYLWRGRGPVRKGVIVRFPVTKNANIGPYFEGMNQYYINEGYDYIVFNFQRDRASRTENEYDITSDDELNSAAVVRYAQERSDKVVLFGESNGTLFVIRTVKMFPRQRLGLVLRGLVKGNGVTALQNNLCKVALIQGENDPYLAPLEAKESAEKIFGTNVFDANLGLFHSLSDEGHTPRRLRSKAEVAAAIGCIASRL